MKGIFSPQSKYTKQARFVAWLWTLLIFIGCLAPARTIPKVDVPLADKWVHFVMFGTFTFLVLCSSPQLRIGKMLQVAVLGIAFGILIEFLQLSFPVLHRAYELLDIVADSIGAVLGVLLFSMGALVFKKI